MSEIDTSIDGFKHIGINLTQKQYEDLIALNLQMQCNKEIPIFNIMVLLKLLGLLPPEMISEESDDECSNNLNEDFNNWFQRRYGKRKES